MKKIMLFFCASMLLAFTACTSKNEKKQNEKEIKFHQASAYTINSFQKEKKEKDKLKNYIKKMSLEEKIAQLFIINLEGNTSFRSYETYNSITEDGSSKPLVAGGYLFFSFNLGDTAEQTEKYIDSIRDYCSKNNSIQPFLAIDQEGGYVNRLRKLTGGLPSEEKVAEKYTVQQAYELYSDQAEKMKELGFNMNLAPVVEVCTEENREFLEGRSFGNIQKTTDYSFSAINGYQNNGVAAVIKHFPGNSNTDPHTGLPEILSTKEELEENLMPFKAVMNIQPEGILMSHAITKAIDDGTPACLSKVWVTDILRNKYKYNGIIFSDDIFMGALADNGYPPETAVVKAVEAGIDCIMISEKRFSKPAKVLYKLSQTDKELEKRINDSVERILLYKTRNGLLEL